MSDVIPSHLGGVRPDAGMFSNVRLRAGEVQRIYYPKDPKNVSKRFIEYDVYVQHRGNDTALGKMYNHCAAWDLFGGLADTFTATYRADPAAARKDAQKRVVQGKGSKVLLLCFNGESQNAIIIGGFRDSNGAVDTEEAGHNLRFRFNGVQVVIDKDGALALTVDGATDNDGKTLKDPLGTSIKIASDGEVTIDSKKAIRLGAGAQQPFMLGNDTVDLMGKIIDAITQITVFTQMGTSSVPLNVAQFEELKAQLEQLKSKLVYGK